MTFADQFETLAAAIAEHGEDGVYGEVGEVVQNLGMALLDESGGSDINLEYSIAEGGRRLVLGYLFVPVDEGEPVDQRYDLTIMHENEVVKERRWRSVEGRLVEPN